MQTVRVSYYCGEYVLERRERGVRGDTHRDLEEHITDANCVGKSLLWWTRSGKARGQRDIDSGGRCTKGVVGCWPMVSVTCMVKKCWIEWKGMEGNGKRWVLGCYSYRYGHGKCFTHCIVSHALTAFNCKSLSLQHPKVGMMKMSVLCVEQWSVQKKR